MRKILSIILFVSTFCMISCKGTDKHTVEVPLPYEFADDTLVKYIKLFQKEYKDKIAKLLNRPHYKEDELYPPRPYISIDYSHNDDTDLFIIYYNTCFHTSFNVNYGIIIYVDNIPCIIHRTDLSPLLADDYLKIIQSTYKNGLENGLLWINGFSQFWYLTYKNGEFVSLEIKDY